MKNSSLIFLALFNLKFLSAQCLQPCPTFPSFQDAPAPPSFVDLNADFENFFDFIFAYLGVPNFHGSTLDNLYSSRGLDLCSIHKFVLYLTTCDLLAENCDFKDKNYGATLQRDSPRIYINRDLQGIQIHLNDDMGNKLEVKKNEYFNFVRIRTSWGSFLILNETESNSNVDAHSYMGDLVVVCEDENTRKVFIRNMMFESQQFDVELERTNFSCFFCDCR